MQMILRRRWRFCLPILLLIFLWGMAGCGGDDDDDEFGVVPPPGGNQPPTAAAGPDLTVLVGREVVLDGSASSDPEQTPLLFDWEIVLRPAGSNAALSDPSAQRPALIPDVAGEYRITLVVNDGQAASSPDLVVVRAIPPGTNTNPEAVIDIPGFPDGTVQVGSLVTFDGSRSSDPDGDPLTFAWAIVAQPPTSFASLSGADTATPSLIPAVTGTYEIQLTVLDDRGGLDTETVLLTAVSPGANRSPIAVAGPDLRADPGSVVQLNGSDSQDPDGDTLRFEWEFLERPPGSGAVLSSSNTATPLFVPDAEGSYRIRLTVNDLRGAAASDEVTVSVLPPGANLPPVAEVEFDRFVAVGSLVTLDGSASLDPEGEPLTFSWSLFRPAGSVAVLAGGDTPTPSFTADDFGEYQVRLTVRDPQGATGSTSLVITAR